MKQELTPLQATSRLKALDLRLGFNVGAVRERRRLRAIIAKHTPKGNNLDVVLQMMRDTER